VRPVAVLTGLVVLTLLVTWPAEGPGVWTQQAIGHPYGDLADHYWGTWWFGRELLEGRLPTSTNMSHFPDALRLWYVDPLGALIALPLRLLGFPMAWNGLLFVQVFGTALATWLAARDLLGREAAPLATVVVAGHPFVLGLLHSGLSEYLGLWPVVLFTWAAIRGLGLDPQGRPPPARAPWYLGFALLACALQAPYYAVFAGLWVACCVPGDGWQPRLGAVVRGLTRGVALCVPVAVAVGLSLMGAAAVDSDTAPGWALAELPATDVLTFVRGGAYYFPDTVEHGNPGILHVNYVGWAALSLAVLGLVRDPRVRPLGRAFALYGVLALGPRLAFAKKLPVLFGGPVLLPLALLYFPGSPVRLVHQPYRMVVFLIPLVALMAAAGALRLPPVARWVAIAVILGEAAFVSPAQWPLQSMDVRTPALFSELEEPGAVLDWPPDATTWNRHYMTWQLGHERPVPYGVNVWIEEDLRKDPLVGVLLRALEDPTERARNRDVPFPTELVLPVDDGASRLAELGFRYVVVHKSALSNLEWGRAKNILRLRLGDPVAEDREHAAWDTRGEPVQPGG